MGLLISLLIGCLVFYVIYRVIIFFVEVPFQKIALLILAVVFIIWLLSFLPMVPWHYNYGGVYGGR